jgi:RecJ-like exonuclease
MSTTLIAHTCPRCNGSGHDSKGAPIVKMVPFDPKIHREYIDAPDNAPFTHKQFRYHQTIKQGSGCLMCGGRGFTEVTNG